MKTIILITAMQLGTLASSAQNSATNWTDLDVLYLGFENRVNISSSSNDGKTLTLTATNCLVTRMEDPNVYILKPGTNSSASITLSSEDKEGNSVIVDKKQVTVKPLPQPTVYWGNSPAGKKASLSNTKLRIAYPLDSQLKANFEILRWSMHSEHGSANGAGSDIAAAKEVLQKVKSDTDIQFVLDVKGADGVVRRISANWIVSPL
jgi:hypothetical protein